MLGATRAAVTARAVEVGSMGEVGSMVEVATGLAACMEGVREAGGREAALGAAVTVEGCLAVGVRAPGARALAEVAKTEEGHWVGGLGVGVMEAASVAEVAMGVGE